LRRMAGRKRAKTVIPGVNLPPTQVKKEKLSRRLAKRPFRLTF
jgi:hypothetical protein